jgi:hypothetical protein
MNKPLIQRLYSLSLAAVVTLAILGGVSQLFLGDSAPQGAEMAQHSSPVASQPRA